MWRNNSIGGWRCRVKAKARQYPKDRDWWHAPDGGYVKRRKRILAAQRADITERLKQLEQEAQRLAES